MYWWRGLHTLSERGQVSLCHDSSCSKNSLWKAEESGIPGIVCNSLDYCNSISAILGSCYWLGSSCSQISKSMAERPTYPWPQMDLLFIHGAECNLAACMVAVIDTIPDRLPTNGYIHHRLCVCLPRDYPTRSLEFLQIGEWAFEQCWTLSCHQDCASAIWGTKPNGISVWEGVQSRRQNSWCDRKLEVPSQEFSQWRQESVSYLNSQILRTLTSIISKLASKLNNPMLWNQAAFIIIGQTTELYPFNGKILHQDIGTAENPYEG